MSLIETVGYHMAYMFKYSLREKTHAHRNYTDDVPEEVKARRLEEIVSAFRRTTKRFYEEQVGTTQVVLIEGPNKRNPEELVGKNDAGQRVMLPHTLELAASELRHRGGERSAPEVELHPGMYVDVEIRESSMASLKGVPTRIRSQL